MARSHKIASEALTFEQFERKFDMYVGSRTGLGYMDFADFDIRSCYDSQMTLEETFEEMCAMQDEGAEFLMDLFG
jgi:hypothetical protein